MTARNGDGGSSPAFVFLRCEPDILSFGVTEKSNTAVADNATDQLVPSACFLTALDAATEARVAEIVRRAIGSVVHDCSITGAQEFFFAFASRCALTSAHSASICRW